MNACITMLTVPAETDMCINAHVRMAAGVPAHRSQLQICCAERSCAIIGATCVCYGCSLTHFAESKPQAMIVAASVPFQIDYECMCVVREGTALFINQQLEMLCVLCTKGLHRLLTKLTSTRALCAKGRHCLLHGAVCHFRVCSLTHFVKSKPQAT